MRRPTPAQTTSESDTGTVHILPWDDTPSEEVPAGKWGGSVVALVMGEEPTARLAGIRGLVGT
jgi:hypothetical protein